jgi:methyltransferase
MAGPINGPRGSSSPVLDLFDADEYVGSMVLGWAHLLITFVALQRLVELVYARRNTQALLARGAIETGARHYPLMVLLHGGWLIALAVFTPPNPDPRWQWLAVFFVCQGLRAWVLTSLGPYWTTRVITLPGAAPVRAGPYRYIRHPNYLIVAIEIPALPLGLGLPWVALVFGLFNLALLAYRIHVEDGARKALTAAG